MQLHRVREVSTRHEGRAVVLRSPLFASVPTLPPEYPFSVTLPPLPPPHLLPFGALPLWHTPHPLSPTFQLAAAPSPVPIPSLPSRLSGRNLLILANPPPSLVVRSPSPVLPVVLSSAPFPLLLVSPFSPASVPVQLLRPPPPASTKPAEDLREASPSPVHRNRGRCLVFLRRGRLRHR